MNLRGWSSVAAMFSLLGSRKAFETEENAVAEIVEPDGAFLDVFGNPDITSTPDVFAKQSAFEVIDSKYKRGLNHLLRANELRDGAPKIQEYTVAESYFDAVFKEIQKAGAKSNTAQPVSDQYFALLCNGMGNVKKGLGKVNEAIQYHQKAVGLNSNDEWFQFDLADALEQKALEVEASLGEVVVDIDEEQSSQAQEEVVAPSKMEEMIALQQAANRIYHHRPPSQIKEDNPRFAQFKEAMAMHEEVVKYFDEEIKKNPSTPMLHYYRGISRKGTGWSKESKTTDNDNGSFKDFDQEIKINPNPVLAYVAMGDTYLMPYDQKQQYQKALELDAKNPVLEEGERKRLEDIVEKYANSNPLYDTFSGLLPLILKGWVVMAVAGGIIELCQRNPNRNRQENQATRRLLDGTRPQVLQAFSDMLKREELAQTQDKKSFIEECKDRIKIDIEGLLQFALDESIEDQDKMALVMIESLQLCQLFADLLAIRSTEAFNQERLDLFNDFMLNCGVSDEKKKRIYGVLEEPLKEISRYLGADSSNETYIEKTMKGAYQHLAQRNVPRRFPVSVSQDCIAIAMKDSVVFLQDFLANIQADLEKDVKETLNGVIDRLVEEDEREQMVGEVGEDVPAPNNINPEESRPVAAVSLTPNQFQGG